MTLVLTLVLLLVMLGIAYLWVAMLINSWKQKKFGWFACIIIFGPLGATVYYLAFYQQIKA